MRKTMKKIVDTMFNICILDQSRILSLIDHIMNKYPKYKYSLEFFISNDVLRVKVYDRDPSIHIVEDEK